jgi:GT2 family glycosyltransferase
MPEASVIVLTYNSVASLSACLEGLRLQTHSDFEVIVIDNASSDGSADAAERCYPEAVVVRNATNIGYAAGCNMGFRCAGGAYLAVLGPDCEPEPGWLAGLIRACKAPGTGLATSMVRKHEDRSRINTCGNDVHVLGLGFCHGLDDEWQKHLQPGPVASISGCSFAIPRRVLEQVGGFDKDFFMYCEDTDLSLRVWLAGLRVVYEPSSVAFHHYRLDVRPQKFFHLERNRYLVLAKNLHMRALLRLAPALLVGELMMWTYAARHGPAFLGAKVRAWRWLICHRDRVRRRWAEIDAIRRCGDRVPLALMTPRLPDRQVLGTGGLARSLRGVANAFFRTFLALALRAAG